MHRDIATPTRWQQYFDIYLLILAATISFVLLNYSHQLWVNEINDTVPIYDNLMQAKVFLWKGRSLAERVRDETVRLEDALPHFDAAHHHIEDARKGRSAVLGMPGEVGAETRFEKELVELQRAIREFRRLVRQQWTETAGLGLHITFHNIERSIDNIAGAILLDARQTREYRERVQTVVLLSWLGLMTASVFLLNRARRKRKLSRDALVEAHDELDKRVEQRTAELSVANKGLQKEILQRKRSEEVLRKAEDRLKLKLESILNPNSTIEVNELSNVIDVDRLRVLLEKFTEVTSMATAILDIRGSVLVATGWQDLCAKFHRVNPDSAKNCVESDTFLTKNIVKGKWRLYKCKNNLCDIATPLYLGDKHVGNVFLGQFFLCEDEFDERVFLKQADTYGFDKEAYLSALAHIPRINQQELDSMMNFMVGLTSLISELSFSNINQAIAITSRDAAEERLRQSEKMNAIGQLAGGIAHDFNNQLSPVVGYADMLIKRLEDDTLSQYAANIKTAALRAADLTAQLLAFGRKGKYLSIPVEMHKVLMEVVSILEHTFDKRIQIRQTLNASPAITMGDPTQLQNALLNIALNARDAMVEGGELVLETSIAEVDEHFCKEHLPDLVAGHYLKISITDTGCGMDGETREHLFEPFFTTKEQGEGTGMGLASVYGTMHNHKGTITVSSELGHGSTFCLYFPLAESARQGQATRGLGKSMTGTARILLVDDEETVREIATDMLKELGHAVTACKDGKEAVLYYETSWQDIDVVILDMVMPELGGRDTFAAMKQINPDVRAILSSGYSLDGEAQSILDGGVMAFVGKPYELAELSRKVSQVLARG